MTWRTQFCFLATVLTTSEVKKQDKALIITFILINLKIQNIFYLKIMIIKRQMSHMFRKFPKKYHVFIILTVTYLLFLSLNSFTIQNVFIHFTFLVFPRQNHAELVQCFCINGWTLQNHYWRILGYVSNKTGFRPVSWQQQG